MSILKTPQPHVTLSGHPIRDIPAKFPHLTESICPACKKPLRARRFVENRQVFMEKECVEHGYFREKISSDADFYARFFSFKGSDGNGIANPAVTGANSCPKDCGLCNMHCSGTSLAVIDLSSEKKPSHEQLISMLKTVRGKRPHPAESVFFQVGTGFPDNRLNDAVRAAKEAGFSEIHAEFNKPLDAALAKSFAEAGLSLVYIPSANDIEACKGAGLRAIIVSASLDRDMIELACRHCDTVDGIFFCSNLPLTDTIKESARLAGDLSPLENWFPVGVSRGLFHPAPAGFNSCHPDCGAISYIFTGNKGAKPLSNFFDLGKFFAEGEKTPRALKKYFDSKNAPRGISFKKFAASAEGQIRSSIFIAALNFQNAASFDAERAKRCATHKISPNGRMHPYCMDRFY